MKKIFLCHLTHLNIHWPEYSVKTMKNEFAFRAEAQIFMLTLNFDSKAILVF